MTRNPRLSQGETTSLILQTTSCHVQVDRLQAWPFHNSREPTGHQAGLPIKHHKRGDLSHQTCSYNAPGSSVDPLPSGGCPGPTAWQTAAPHSG